MRRSRTGHLVAAAAVAVCIASVIASAERSPGGRTREHVRATVIFQNALVGPEETRVEVTGDIKLGRSVSGKTIEYPPDVLAEGIGGTVEVALLVDRLGRVTDARLLKSVDPRLDALCLEAARALSFGPSTQKDGRPVGLAVVAAYTFSLGEERRTEPTALVTPGWEKEFDRAYALGEGQALKLVRPPYPASRMDFYRTSSPSQALAIPEGPARMTVLWDPGSARLKRQEYCFGGSRLEGLLFSLRLESYAISSDRELLDTEVPCDLVLRKGAAIDDYVSALEKALLTEFGLPVRMRFTDEERAAIVARGSYTLHPLPEVGGDNAVQIYLRELDTGPGFAGGGTASVAGLLEALAHTLQCPVVNEVEPSNARVQYVIHSDARRTAYADEVLRNVSAQTGLVFVRQPRPVRILHVTRGE